MNLLNIILLFTSLTIKLSLRNTWEGAEGICWLVSSKADNITSGEFYLDREPTTKHLAGPFFTEGSYTKNTKEEVDNFLKNMSETAGV